MVKLKKELSVEERSLCVLSLLSLFNSDLGTLTEPEGNLVKSILNLPDKLKSVPFSLSARKYISEQTKRSMLNINRAIDGINEKGYLSEDFNEYDFKPGIKELIWLASSKNDLVIQISLGIKEQTELKETEDDQQELGSIDSSSNEEIQ